MLDSFCGSREADCKMLAVLCPDISSFPVQLLENAAGVIGSASDLTAQFDAAVANSLSVVRMFGFGTAGGFQLQYSPGSYNEKAFQAFDKVTQPHASMCTSSYKLLTL